MALVETMSYHQSNLLLNETSKPTRFIPLAVERFAERIVVCLHQFLLGSFLILFLISFLIPSNYSVAV